MISGSRALAGRIMALVAAILFGCESIAVQLCYANGFTVMSLIVVRYGLAALFFAITIAVVHQSIFVEKPYRIRVFVLGLLFAASNWLLFVSLAYLPAALAILFFYAYPALTALIARLFYHQRLGMTKGIALILSAIGLVLLYWSSLEELTLIGVAAALSAALINAIKMNMAQKVLEKVNAYTFSFNMSIMMFLISLPVGIIEGQLTFDIPAIAWVYAIGLGLFVSYGSMLLYNQALSRISAVDVSIICLIEPPVTAIMAFFVFGDTLGSWQIVGALILLVSVGLPQFSQLYQSKTSKVNKIDAQ